MLSLCLDMQLTPRRAEALSTHPDLNAAYDTLIPHSFLGNTAEQDLFKAHLEAKGWSLKDLASELASEPSEAQLAKPAWLRTSAGSQLSFGSKLCPECTLDCFGELVTQKWTADCEEE